MSRAAPAQLRRSLWEIRVSASAVISSESVAIARAGAQKLAETDGPHSQATVERVPACQQRLIGIAQRPGLR